MKQETFLPFSSLVASMLLFSEKITSVEIINFISFLSGENIFVDDDDDIGRLFLCVECYNYVYFKIKDGMDYDSFLETGETVREFLNKHANQEIIDLIESGKCVNFFNYDILNKEVVAKKKVRSKIFKITLKHLNRFH